MDISVLAAVGSFAVSERILKPKATVLVILGCILAYDLTTKTHDVSSLRVYRGKSRAVMFARTLQYNFYVSHLLSTVRPCIVGLYLDVLCIFLTNMATEWSSV